MIKTNAYDRQATQSYQHMQMKRTVLKTKTSEEIARAQLKIVKTIRELLQSLEVLSDSQSLAVV